VQCIELRQDDDEYVTEASLLAYDGNGWKQVTVLDGLAAGLTKIWFDAATSAWTWKSETAIPPTVATTTTTFSNLTNSATWSMDSTLALAKLTTSTSYWSVYELSFYKDPDCTSKLDTPDSTTGVARELISQSRRLTHPTGTTTSGYYGQNLNDTDWQPFNAFGKYHPTDISICSNTLIYQIQI
jgi:hypothetical protein